MTRKKIPAGKWLLRILCGFLIFILLGVLLPPLKHSSADEISAAGRTSENSSASERVLCLDDNDEALLWRLRLIEAAQDNIALSTFDFRDDESGLDIMAALLDAAERGLQIRILLDGFCPRLYLSDSICFAALLSLPNVEAYFYNPVDLLTPWTVNYRMHDKYLIADDFAYIMGGRNTCDLFLGSSPGQQNIDRDVLVYAAKADSSLSALRDYFQSVWGLKCNRPIRYSMDEQKLSAAKAELRNRFRDLESRIERLSEPFSWAGQTMETSSVTLLSNPVEAKNKAPVLWNVLCDFMAGGSEIAIQTPYVVCSRSMYDELSALCDDGSRRLTVYTNAAETGANLLGRADYLYSRDDILNTGAALCEYAGDRSMHTKTVLIDDRLSIIGSFNVDMRSTYLDTELMLAIDCPALNALLREQLAEIAAKSRFVSSDGAVKYGQDYTPASLSPGKHILRRALGLVIRPIRYLL